MVLNNNQQQQQDLTKLLSKNSSFNCASQNYLQNQLQGMDQLCIPDQQNDLESFRLCCCQHL
ncbi:hypothetical protein DERF_010433 [Dermatophagoides farinae]|uniref:Uncharacterized protein n=1 Tax=Dermatophagoides farinae TaxID=6954 RepID=A0A922L2K0_DERFA|nr:hypothetical protein DERF_010433 [Dermatophagoides farinae]